MTISEGLIKKLEKQEIVSRDDVQKLAVQISTEYDKILFLLATRIGKSKIIMDIVKHHDYKRILFVMAQDIHIANFIKDCEKFNVDISPYTMICWNSYHKYIDNDYDMVICDEFDVSFENHISFMDKCKWKKYVLLSATSTFEQQTKLRKLGFFKWVVTLAQAISWQILPAPTVWLKRLTIDSKFQKQLTKIEDEIAYWKEKADENGWTENRPFNEKEIAIYRKKYGDNKGLLTKEQVKAYIAKNGKEPYYLTKKVPTWDAIQVNQRGLARKALYEEIKYKWFKDENIFQRLSDKRTIFFLPDINLSKELGNSISSLESSKENKALLEAFNSESIQFLISNKILVRGVNLYNINWGYFGRIDLNGGALEQSLARVLLGVAPSVVIPFVAYSKEQTVLFKFLEKNKLEPKYL